MSTTLTKLPVSTPITTEDAQRAVDQIRADDELAWQVAAELDREPRLLLAKLFALEPAQQAGLSRMRLERVRSTFAPVARALREGDPVFVRINEVAVVTAAFSCSFKVEVSSDGVTVEGSIST
ncbi:hypothetical protein [Nonomuraea rhizosphaerae]|uniref:hypothetical protein n=1 Tax=Nonomuraea rhizosphaerae TaxID=2665663 RepID=UPI001C5F30CF|nr:hypothetical protein [Nonomuraea rhizosphaerae]